MANDKIVRACVLFREQVSGRELKSACDSERWSDDPSAMGVPRWLTAFIRDPSSIDSPAKVNRYHHQPRASLQLLTF